MLEGYRPIRVEENPDELRDAGYTVQYSAEDYAVVTDAPVDWAPDDLKPSPEVTVTYPPPPAPQAPLPPDVPAASPTAAPAPEIKPLETVTPPSPSIDDLWKEHEKPTEDDLGATETGAEAGAETKPDDAAATDQPKEGSTEAGSIADDDYRGKLSDSQYKETKMAVRLIHHGVQNGNAWLMQALVGEGEVAEYKAFDKDNFEVWTELGTKLCAKHGITMPLELSYAMASAANLGPAWQMAIKLNREKKKNEKLSKENEELRWKNWIMQNYGGAVPPGGIPPQPPKDYPTVTAPSEAAKKEGVPTASQVGEWVFDPAKNQWHGTKSKRIVPHVDGDYIFDPVRGVQVHKLTGAIKTGRPKGSGRGKQKKTHREVWIRDGKFMSKEEIAIARARGEQPTKIIPLNPEEHNA